MMINLFVPNVPKYLFQSKPDTDLSSLKPVVYTLGHTTAA